MKKIIQIYREYLFYLFATRMYPRNETDDSVAYAAFNARTTELLDRLKKTSVTASSHAEVLFQFSSQLGLHLYASSAEITKDLKETASLRSDAHLAVFLVKLYTSAADLFRTHRGFKMISEKTEPQVAFAKELIETYVTLAQKSALSVPPDDASLHPLNAKLMQAYNDIGVSEALIAQMEKECVRIKALETEADTSKAEAHALRAQLAVSQQTVAKLETERQVFKQQNEALKKKLNHALVAIGKLTAQTKTLQEHLLAKQTKKPPAENKESAKNSTASARPPETLSSTEDATRDAVLSVGATTCQTVLSVADDHAIPTLTLNIDKRLGKPLDLSGNTETRDGWLEQSARKDPRATLKILETSARKDSGAALKILGTSARKDPGATLEILETSARKDPGATLEILETSARKDPGATLESLEASAKPRGREDCSWSIPLDPLPVNKMTAPNTSFAKKTKPDRFQQHSNVFARHNSSNANETARISDQSMISGVCDLENTVIAKGAANIFADQSSIAIDQSLSVGDQSSLSIFQETFSAREHARKKQTDNPDQSATLGFSRQKIEQAARFVK